MEISKIPFWDVALKNTKKISFDFRKYLSNIELSYYF